MVTTMAPHAIDQGFESLAQPTHIFLGISPLEDNITRILHQSVVLIVRNFWEVKLRLKGRKIEVQRR